MASRSLHCLIAFFFFLTFQFTVSSGAFGQGAKIKSAYDSIEEEDQDRPDQRAEWMNRGRTAPAGQTAAALRLRAHQQKMLQRARRAAADANPAGATPSSTGWVALGPAPLVSDRNFYGMVSGRSTAIAIDPSDRTGNTVYAAGAFGGVWKSTNAAISDPTQVTWTAVTDQEASLANGAVSVKNDGSVVLVGTGEPNSAIDSYYGVGILRSTDHGTTWTLVSSADGTAHPFAGLGVSKFAWLPNTNTVIAATATTAKGFDEGNITSSTNRGLYLSTNGGQSWAYQAPSDGGTTISPISVTDIVYEPISGHFIASIRYHGLYSSVNGTNWTRMASQPAPLSTSNCPPTGNSSTCPLYRGQLAVVPGRDEVYFWFVSINAQGNMVDEGIWRSINGGAWVQIDETGITDCGDGDGCGVKQSYYNLEIAAVPDGSSQTDLYAGTINLYKCVLPTNQTTCKTVDLNLPNSWLNLTHVYGSCSNKAMVHPDQHGIDFMVVGGKDIMYFGNDGGVYRALDGFTGLSTGSCNTAGNNAFDNLNGTLGSMTQLVSFSVHPTDQNTVLGGTQDNGSPASTNATGSSQFFTANGGDGGYNAIDAANNLWYTADTDVSVQVCSTPPSCTTASFSRIVTAGTATIGLDHGAFYSPYILDPQNSNELLIGTCRIWRGSTAGTNFSALSVNFDMGVSSTCSGGETNLVRAIAAGGAKDNSGFSNVVYATTEGTGPNCTPANACNGPLGGEVWVTTNASTTQMSNVTGTIHPQNYTISSVVLDITDGTGNTAYVGIMGFVGSTNAHVFKTTNAGQTWTAFGDTGSGPPDAPVNALLVDGAAGKVYAGTDVGVFVSLTSSAAWTEVGPAAAPGATGYLPNVPVSALRMFNSGGTKKLRVSTYGRGIWEYTLVATADFTNAISNSPQTVFPTQTAIFNGTLTAVNSYNSTVNLTCTGTPPTTCNLPPSVSFTAGVATYTVTAGGTVRDYSFSAHAVGTDGNTTTHDAAATLHVVDFAMGAVNPNPVSVPLGLTATATFQVTPSGSFGLPVTLSCTGLPANATCSFSPSNTVNPTTSPVTVTLTVSAAPSTPQGTTTVTVQGATSAPAATRTTTFSLTVTAPPDFTWTNSGGSTSHTALAGQTTLAYNFTSTPTAGATTFAGDVTFACSGLPDTTAVCAFNTGQTDPTKIKSGSGTTSVALTITTKGPNAGTGAAVQRRADRRSPGLLRILPIAGLVLAGLAGRKVLRPLAFAGLCASLAMISLMLACGGVSSGGPSPPPAVSVTITPSTAVNLYANETGNTWAANLTQQQFAAAVHNSTNQSVTWAVSGGGANGSIDSTGLYTAPAMVPNPAAVTITATAAADPSKSGSGRVNLQAPTTLGTFNVTATATEGTIAHSQSVTLTVQ
ncbi:MAG: hypothetical protein LAO56_08760 [Acidobacteriia bacterium]|nr:hypothetical protein [Terriglobia bacterium]